MKGRQNSERQEPAATAASSGKRRLLSALLRRGHLRIGTRLAACFAAIILSMLVANLVAVWQFRRMTDAGQRLDRADRISLAVTLVHLDLDILTHRLSALANTRDGPKFASEAASVNRKFLEDVASAEQMFTGAGDTEHDPVILSTLQTLRVTLPSQVDALIALAEVDDWPGVRARLSDQVQGLVGLGAMLVERVDHDVSAKRAQAIESSQRAQRKILLVLPATALMTMLLAVVLGWHATRSITGPLSELYSGAQALAHGQFHHEVEVAGEDELATVGRAFNYAARRLRELYDGLRDSEEQWRAAFKSNPTMYFIIDAEGVVASVNTLGAEQLGYSVEELFGRLVLQVVYPPDRQIVQKHIQDCFAQPGRMMRWEIRKVRKDGTILWARETANAVFLKKRLVLLVVAEDITERKRAEESLRESEERFRIAFENALVGMALVDMNGYPIKCNPALEKMLGYTEAELCRMAFTDFTFPDDRALDWRLYSELVNGERSKYEINKRYITKDGRVIWGRLIVSLVRDTNGVPKYGLAMAEDFTERQRAEEERERLRQLQSELAHINRVSMMGELAASLGHEITQPIAAAAMNARTCLRWLQREPPQIGEARQCLSRLINDIDRTAGIIDRNRSLYRRGAPQREPLDLNEIIREMVVLLHDAAHRHSISIRTDLDAALPMTTADRVQLQQVFMNLMLNGIEAMKDDSGQLSVTSNRAGDGQLSISVSDSGIGLPNGEPEGIFEAFFTTKPQGTGLGLSISRRIVESHGGRLWATPNAGRGVTFQFTLPAR